MADPEVLRLILAGAKRHNLSPAAVLAVALGEGGLNFVNPGDAGTSHGPFQLRGNDAPGGGASPFGVAETRRRAEARSPWIVNEPLRQMAALGISGMTPAQQVENIIRRFERPADPDSSVRNALARLTSGELRQYMKGVVEDTVGGGAGKKGGGPTVSLNDDWGVGGGGGGGGAASATSVAREMERVLSQPGPLRTEDLIDLEIMRRQAQDQRTSAEVLNGEIREKQGTKKKRATNTKSGPSRKEWAQLRGIGNTSPDFMLKAIKKAQQLGLSVRENPYVDPVDPVHVEGSFHHQNFPGTFNGKRLGRAIDLNGSAEAKEKFFRWAIKYRPSELFWDPLGQYDNGRYSSAPIGGHDHVHLSV